MARKAGKLQITLKKSLIGCCPKARKTAAALGLRRINQMVVRPANDSIRGMVKAIDYLVAVEDA